MLLIATGWWTVNRVLVSLNVVLAAAAVGTAIVGIVTIKSSNKVVTQAKRQADASVDQAKASEDQAKATDRTLAVSVRPVIVDVPLRQDFREWHPPAVGGSAPSRIRRRLRTGFLRSLFVSSSSTFRSGKNSKGSSRPPSRAPLRSPAAEDRSNRWSDTGSSLQVRMPVRNIGAGPAFVVEVLLMLDPDNGLPASLDRKVIPSGETARFLYRTFSFTEAAPLLRSALYADTLEIAIKYADIGEGQRTQTVISLAKNLTEHTFRVTNLKLYKCDTYWKREESPFATTESLSSDDDSPG